MALQGLQFNTAARAPEYRDLHSGTTAKLQKCWHLTAVKPKMPSLSELELSPSEQLDKVVALVVEQAKRWVNSLLDDMSALQTEQGSSQPADAAEVTVHTFQQGASHAWQMWADPDAAPQHLSPFCSSQT